MVAGNNTSNYSMGQGKKFELGTIEKVESVKPLQFFGSYVKLFFF